MRILTGSTLAFLFLVAPFGTTPAASSPSAFDAPRPLIESEGVSLRASETTRGMFPVAGFDFRNASWLMEHDAVRSSEDLPILSDDGKVLTRLTTIQGLEVVLGYFFGDDGLFEGGAYFFELGSGNTRQQLAAYRMVRVSLLRNFGDPLRTRLIWSDETYKGDADNWLKALRLGHVAVEAFWRVDGTIIRHKLSSAGQDGFLHALNYAHAGRLAADSAAD
ncbi:MAG: hypothetical protein IID55_02795 [Proteobacteria bacterium]|nr:hypothetical protein [Pseudomonadota bacterium]